MIINQLTNILKKIEKINGIILTGSYFHKRSNTLSDIDLIIYADDSFDISMLPRDFNGKILDIKVIKTSHLDSNLLETKYHTLRMAADEFNSELLYGKRPIAKNTENFEFDMHLKVLSKYLSFTQNDLDNALIDSKKSIKYGKVSYRKLRNLIKTFNELSFPINQDSFSHLSNLTNQLEDKILYSCETQLFNLEKVKIEMHTLFMNYMAAMKSKYITQSHIDYTPVSIDEIWTSDLENSKKLSANEIIDNLINLINDRWENR